MVPLLDFAVLEQLVQVAFSHRRKLLKHSLGPWLAQQAPGLSFDLQRRAEEVSVDAYIALAQQVCSVSAAPR